MNNKTGKKIVTLVAVAICATSAMAFHGGPRGGFHHGPRPMHHGGWGGYHRHHHHNVGLGIAAGVVGAAATAAIVRDIVAPRPVVYTTPAPVYTTPVYTTPAPVYTAPAPVVVQPAPVVVTPPPPVHVYRW